MSEPRSPNAIPNYLSDYMASCVHSEVGTNPGIRPLFAIYFCRHPVSTGPDGSGICGAMGGSLAKSKTIRCHRRYKGPGAITEHA